MLPNDSTTRSEVVTLPAELEALIVAAARDAARPLVSFLKDERLNVSLVQDADGGFEEALLHRPNLILVHQDLPGTSGTELCRRLKANTRTHFIPTVVIAGGGDEEAQRVRAYAAGADAFFAPSTGAEERHARLWALLQSQALYRRQDRKREAQGSAFKERGRWIGTFVHDLQNLVGALQANFEFLSQSAGANAPDRSDDVGECARETRALVQQLSRGLRTVQEYERFESGRVQLKEGRVRIPELLVEVKEELAGQAPSPQKTIVLAGGAELEIAGDRDLLRQAVSGLLAYLLRQARTTRVVLSGTRTEDGIRLSIAANGDSPPVEEGDRIFDPYVKVSRRAPLAHGLGLALAKVIVELHGGKLALEAAPDGGTVFAIDLKSRVTSPNSLLGE